MQVLIGSANPDACRSLASISRLANYRLPSLPNLSSARLTRW